MTVSPSYQHRAKQARAQSAVIVGATALKWYDLEEPGLGVADQTRAVAQSVAASLPGPNDTAGFAILHRCSADFHFLLTALWRGNNEIWQSVNFIDAQTKDFTAFPPAYAPLGHPRPTFCVWEMGIVAHEAQAWQRFLFSDRSQSAMRLWQEELFTGTV